jgi:hypothetical protein
VWESALSILAGLLTIWLWYLKREDPAERKRKHEEENLRALEERRLDDVRRELERELRR